jgi:hypothetical protein
MNTSRGSTRSWSRGSEPLRLPRLRSRELSSRSRGSSPQRASNIGHLRRKRQRFHGHAAAQQSCRYNLLRAPATNAICNSRSSAFATSELRRDDLVVLWAYSASRPDSPSARFAGPAKAGHYGGPADRELARRRDRMSRVLLTVLPADHRSNQYGTRPVATQAIQPLGEHDVESSAANRNGAVGSDAQSSFHYARSDAGNDEKDSVTACSGQERAYVISEGPPSDRIRETFRKPSRQLRHGFLAPSSGTRRALTVLLFGAPL